MHEDLLSRAPKPDESYMGSRSYNRRAEASQLLTGDLAERRRSASRNGEGGKVSVDSGQDPVEHVRAAAVKVDGQPIRGGARQDPEREIRAADLLLQTRSVKHVERPSDGLAVGCDEIQIVEDVAKRRIRMRLHHPVHGQRRGSERTPLMRRTRDALYSGVVVDRVDERPEDATLA